jgi:putative transposase
VTSAPSAVATELFRVASRKSLQTSSLTLTRAWWSLTGADVQLIHHSDAGSQYTSYAFNQVLDDHGVLVSIGSVGDAYDNAMAESFVDTFKTELIADRVWRTRTQLELAIVPWVAWFNNDRLHESLDDRPPAEFEGLYAAQCVLTPSLNQ